eukprot:359517-Chlamydomonas_euryale.AAC.5
MMKGHPGSGKSTLARCGEPMLHGHECLDKGDMWTGQEGAWRAHGGHMENACAVQGGRMENAWRAHALRMEGARRVHGERMEDVCAAHGGRMEGAWRTHGGCMRCAWRVHGGRRSGRNMEACRMKGVAVPGHRDVWEGAERTIGRVCT